MEKFITHRCQLYIGNAEVYFVQGPLDKVNEGEVVRAINAMMLGKAAGVSEVAAEHVVTSGKIGVEVLTETCYRLLTG